MYSLKIQLFDSVIYILQLEADKLFPIHRNCSKCSSSSVREGASVKRKMLKKTNGNVSLRAFPIMEETFILALKAYN